MRPGTGIGGQEGEERKGKITYWFPDWRVQTVPCLVLRGSGSCYKWMGWGRKAGPQEGPWHPQGMEPEREDPEALLVSFHSFYFWLYWYFQIMRFQLDFLLLKLLCCWRSLRIFSSFIAHFNSRTIYIHVHVCVLDFFFQFHCIIFSCFLEIWRHSLKYHFKFFAREYNYFFRINHKEIVFFC